MWFSSVAPWGEGKVMRKIWAIVEVFKSWPNISCIYYPDSWEEWIYLRSQVCWLFSFFGSVFPLAVIDLLERIEHCDKRQDQELAIYVNYVERALVFEGIKFYHYKKLQILWLNCAHCQKLNEVFPARRSQERSTHRHLPPRTPPHLLHPRTPHVTEVCKAKIKDVKAETRCNSKPKGQKSRATDEGWCKSQWGDPEVYYWSKMATPKYGEGHHLLHWFLSSLLSPPQLDSLHLPEILFIPGFKPGDRLNCAHV